MSVVIEDYKGCAATVNALPINGNAFGDYYLVISSGLQYWWSIPNPAGSQSNWLPINAIQGTGSDNQEHVERSWMGL